MASPLGTTGSPTASLTFVGTATTVLRLDGFTLLTDPNLVRHARSGRLMVTCRGRNPLRDSHTGP